MRKNYFYSRRCLWWDIFFIVVLCCFACAWWLFYAEKGARSVLPEEWQWERFTSYIGWIDDTGWHNGLLLKGFLHTIRIGFWAGCLALVLGLWLGIRFTVQRRSISNTILYSVVLLLRNTPPLVLLFLLYFLTSENTISLLGDWVRKAPSAVQLFCTLFFASPEQMDRMLAAVLTLGCYQGVYVAEIVRAGLQSLPQGQWDAAAALGFTQRQQIFGVLLPQSLPLLLPPLAGQAVSIFKDSALASLISVPELTFQGMEVMAITRLPFETWILVAFLYFVVSLMCTRVFAYIEGRMHWHSTLSK